MPGVIADTDNNHYLFFGGGHNDYCGNEIYDLNLNTGTVIRANNPSQPSVCKNSGMVFNTPHHIESIPPTGSWGCGGHCDVDQDNFTECSSIICRPNSRHVGDYPVYMNHLRKGFVTGGILTGQGAFPERGTWLWTLDNLLTFEMQAASGTGQGDEATAWTNKSTGNPPPVIGQPGNQFGGSVYDSVTHLVYIYADQFYKYNPDTNALTVIGTTVLPDGEMTGVFNPDDQLIWFFGGDQAFNPSPTSEDGVGYIDPITDTLTFLNHLPCGAPPNTPPNCGNQGVPPGCDATLVNAMSPGAAFYPPFGAIVVWQQPIAYAGPPAFINPEKLALSKNLNRL